MAYKKQDIEEFLDMITGFTLQEKLHLADFEERIYSLYDIKKLVRQVGNATTNFIKSKSEKDKKHALKKIALLKELIIIKFGKFLEEERKEIISEEYLVKKEKDLLAGLEVQQLEEYNKLKQGLESEMKGVRKKIEKMMKYIEEAIKREALDISISKHLEELIILMKEIYRNEADKVKRFYEELNKLEEEAKGLGQYEDTSTIKKIIEEMKVKYVELDEELRTEKRRFIDPFYKFLRQKRRILRLIKRNIEKSKKRKITMNTILKDVHTFTDSNETQRYYKHMISNYWDQLDDKAKRHLHNISRLAGEAGEARKFQLEKSAGLASIDGLTGVKNKRGLINDIYLIKDTNLISAIFIDMDDFKEINDNYGHDIGDKALKVVVNSITISIDKNRVYRYGGDEFVILLPQVPKEKAVETAKKIRKDVENLSKKILEKGITISLGVATLPEDAKNINDLLAAADAALLRAKRAGKGRVKHA